MMSAFLLLCAALGHEPSLPAGDHFRQLEVDGRGRSYLVHVPKRYDRRKPTPVVLAFHGAVMNARAMAFASGLSRKSDDAGFVVVYPNGTGPNESVLFFNAGLLTGPLAATFPDDVKFTAALLDNLATVVNVDQKRIFATGISNGGMMCYRLAGELSERIAAIAPVAGTLAIDRYEPQRGVPVLHFHGTEDRLVPFEGPNADLPDFMRFKSVPETMRLCAAANGCISEPAVADEPDREADGTTVERRTYRPRDGGADLTLIVVNGGGHTWPGMEMPLTGGLLGRVTRDISANDMMWEFFEQHPRR